MSFGAVLAVLVAGVGGDSGGFAINAFEVEGVTLFSEAVVDQVVQPYVGTGRTLDDINAAAEALRGAYEKAGYPVVKVYPPVQAAEQGRIKLKVIEGKIQSVQIKGSQIYSADNIRASLPPLQELRKPNTGQIVAAVAAANENPAKQVAVNFQAAEQLGDIDAIVNVTEENPEKILLTADNMGSKSTGVNRYSLGYQHANLFNRDHMLTLTASTSWDFPQKSLSLSGGYRIPFYESGLSLDLIAAYSDSNATTNVGFGNANQFTGKGVTLGLRLNQVLASIGEYRHRLIYGYDFKDFRNDCTGAPDAPGKCGTITSQPLSISYSAQLNNPAYQLNGSLGWFVNLPGGPNGGNQEYRLNARGGENSWQAWRFSAGAMLPLPEDFQFRVALAGQVTGNRLIAGEQFGVGGSASVRGYMERTATAESGYSVNVELYSPDIGKHLGEGVGLRALVFHDFGRVYSTAGAAQLPLSSVGAGLRFNLGRSLAFKVDVGVTQESFVGGPGTGMSRQRGDSFGHAALNISF